MRTELNMMAAPTGIQPGGYVAKAYSDRVQPLLAKILLESDFARGRGYRITVSWQCRQPVTDISTDTNLFVDACALLVPATDSASWMTMGDAHNPVEGVLWRADKAAPYKIDAKGFGNVVRSGVPEGWSARAERSKEGWQVSFSLGSWAALEKMQKVAVAVWLGAEKERAGLKSVSQGWISLA